MKDKKMLALVRRAAKNDARAFAALSEKIVQEVLYLCVMELGNQQDAQDAAQDVFIILQRNICRLRQPEAFNVWLHRIIQSACNDVRRSQMRKKVDTVGSYDDISQEELLVDRLDELPRDFVERQENQQLVNNLIQNLSDLERRSVVLHYYKRMTYEEVAKVLGATPDMVRRYLRNARAHLKERLEQKVGADYRLNAVGPMVALGPALKVVMDSSAKSIASPSVVQSVLAGANVYAGASTAARLSVLKITSVVLTVAGVGMSAAFTTSQTPRSAPVPQVSASVQPDTSVQALPEAQVTNYDATPETQQGNVGLLTIHSDEPLPAGAVARLLDEQGNLVAEVPLNEAGQARFDEVEELPAGSYVVQAIDASGELLEEMEVQLN